MTVLKIAAALAVFMALVGCGEQYEGEPAGQGVEKIFNVDGCVGYRFMDRNKTHYFVKCGQVTTTDWKIYRGKYGNQGQSIPAWTVP